jgi:adenylate cyclase
MGQEIERKFLVRSDVWREEAHTSKRYRQGYLANNERCSIRVRIDEAKAGLNIKSSTLGVHRQEFEYALPLDEAQFLLDELCRRPLIEKTRYFVQHGRHLWEIDVFAGDNEGLVVAEIELEHAEEDFARPSWLGDEVSDDPRYYNVSLVEYPYKSW